MKYKHKAEIINETDKEDIYNYYKKYIYDYIIDIMDSAFDFDIDLLVVFRELDKKVNYVNRETDNAWTTMIDGKYAIVLNVNSLERIQNDEGLDIAIAIHHEMCHIRDLYHTMHNKFYEINPLLKKHETFDDFLIAKGWEFWTEFYAYYLTFREFKEDHNYPTFLQLVKGYEKLQSLYQELIPNIQDGTMETMEKADDFIDKVDALLYAIAKHAAGSAIGKAKYYQYCQKTVEKDSFVTISKLCEGLMQKVVPLLTNTYGKGMARKMFNLGEYIVEHLYGVFDIWPVRHKGYITFAFYTDDED